MEIINELKNTNPDGLKVETRLYDNNVLCQTRYDDQGNELDNIIVDLRKVI